MTASLFEVVAEPHRRRILDALRDGDRSVTDLVDLLGLAQPTVSKHLKTLRDAQLVVVRPEAQRRWYRLAPEPLRELDHWLSPIDGPGRNDSTPSAMHLDQMEENDD